MGKDDLIRCETLEPIGGKVRVKWIPEDLVETPGYLVRTKLRVAHLVTKEVTTTLPKEESKPVVEPQPIEDEGGINFIENLLPEQSEKGLPAKKKTRKRKQSKK